MVRAFDLRLKRSRVRISAVPVSGNNLGQVVHTHVPLSPSSMIWYRSRGGDALRLGSNHRSGIALAIRHRLQWFIHVHAHGIRKGDEPALLMGYDTTFPFYCILAVVNKRICYVYLLT